MNKRLLVAEMASETKLTRAQAARALESFLRAVRTSLARGERVTLAGFGSFAISRHKARAVRDPRSGAAMRIEARAVPRFAPGLELKMAIDRAELTGQINGKEDDSRYSRSS